MGALEHVCYGCNIPGKVAVTARLVTSVKASLKFWACNVNQDVLREQRLNQWRLIAGSGGVVSLGDVVYLLGLSRSRVRDLLFLGRLSSVPLNGQRRVLFSSVEQYAKEGRQWRLRKRGLKNAKAMN